MYRFGEGTFISMILPASKNPVTPTIRKKFPNRNWTKISGSLESIFQGYVGELLIQLYCYLGGGFNFFSFHPYLGRIPILTSIFFRWVVQPPTSYCCCNDSTWKLPPREISCNFTIQAVTSLFEQFPCGLSRCRWLGGFSWVTIFFFQP